MEYPAQRFVVQPSGRIKQVTLVAIYNTWCGTDWHLSESGKTYKDAELFLSRPEAVTAGKQQVCEAREKLRKASDKLDRKIAVLQSYALK